MIFATFKTSSGAKAEKRLKFDNRYTVALLIKMPIRDAMMKRGICPFFLLCTGKVQLRFNIKLFVTASATARVFIKAIVSELCVPIRSIRTLNTPKSISVLIRPVIANLINCCSKNNNPVSS